MSEAVNLTHARINWTRRFIGKGGSLCGACDLAPSHAVVESLAEATHHPSLPVQEIGVEDIHLAGGNLELRTPRIRDKAGHIRSEIGAIAAVVELRVVLVEGIVLLDAIL